MLKFRWVSIPIPSSNISRLIEAHCEFSISFNHYVVKELLQFGNSCFDKNQLDGNCIIAKSMPKLCQICNKNVIETPGLGRIFTS